jgi:hypothetical protein
MRIAFALLVAVSAFACINQAKQAVAPDPPSGTGALTCSEIVEQCDSQCSDPFCIQRCSEQGNVDGAAQHHALVECGQRNSCTDQACMEASCPGEVQACMGASPPADPSVPTDTTPPPETPGAQSTPSG